MWFVWMFNVSVVAKVNKTGPVKLIPLINPRIVCGAGMLTHKCLTF